METDIVRAAQDSLGAMQTAIDSASALIVAYAFSVTGALLILVIGLVVAGLIERWARSGLSRVRGLDATIVGFLSMAAKYAVLVLVIVTVLAQFGVQTTSIIAALGAAGLAIGLALQGTLQNIAAGLMILVLRPFRVGEYIVAGEVAGSVREIGLFTTELEMADGVYLMSPNSSLWNTPIVNYSRNPRRRFDLEVRIGQRDDVDLARAALMEIARSEPRVLASPEHTTFVKTMGDGAVTVVLRIWSMSGDHFVLTGDLTKAAKERFDAAGISIPPPQQVVTYREAEAA